MSDGLESKAKRLLHPFIERGEVLTVTMVTINRAPSLLVRVAKLDDPALKERIRDALRSMDCPVQFAGPRPKGAP